VSQLHVKRQENLLAVQTQPMEALDVFSTDRNGQISLFAAVTAFAVVALTYFLSHGHEKAVKYEVAIPEQCKVGWKGKVLDEPSIKVRTK